VPACPSGATWQDATGAVRINKDVCIGCGSCVAACPYDARYIDNKRGVADKCDFCSALVEKGLQPACVNTCPANAKHFGDLEDSNSAVAQLVYRGNAQRIETAGIALGPNVYYVGTPEHLELAAASFAPHPPQTVTPGRVWSAFAKKVVYLAVGATFAGQAVAFFRQINVGEKQFDD
jgi:tetrathionate reductase subunit B